MLNAVGWEETWGALFGRLGSSFKPRRWLSTNRTTRVNLGINHPLFRIIFFFFKYISRNRKSKALCPPLRGHPRGWVGEHRELPGPTVPPDPGTDPCLGVRGAGERVRGTATPRSESHRLSPLPGQHNPHRYGCIIIDFCIIAD